MLKNMYKPLLSGLIVILLVAACAPAASISNNQGKTQEDQMSSVADLQTRLSAVQEEINSLQAGQIDVTNLQSRIDSVQSDLDALSTQVAMLNSGSTPTMTDASMSHEETASDPFVLSVAQYVLDSSGFHGIAETISNTQQIDPAFLGTVNRAYKVLSQVTWPEPLMEQGQAFVVTLKDFADALAANDVVEATKLSDEIHDAQHELSHAIDDWLGEATNAHSH
jgi:hypothetical protein